MENKKPSNSYWGYSIEINFEQQTVNGEGAKRKAQLRHIVPKEKWNLGHDIAAGLGITPPTTDKEINNTHCYRKSRHGKNRKHK